MEFFSKDPAEQLVEVKEKLTERLVSVRRRHDCFPDRDDAALLLEKNEIQFLEELLDQMERS